MAEFSGQVGQEAEPQPNLRKEYKLANGITAFGTKAEVEQIRDLVEEFAVLQDINPSTANVPKE